MSTAVPRSGIRSFYARVGKRIIDLLGSAVAIAVLSPIFLVAAALIKVSSRGPVFFYQDRPGLRGHTFRIVKFRSMRTFEDSYDAEGNELTNDQRVTPVGAVLRRTSIDELPQLFNVLVGQMSLVGPRPALLYQVERYTPEQRQRMAVRPGMTGLAQVSGRNSLTWEQKISQDLKYVRNVSLELDVRIVVRTLGVVVSGSGLRFEKHDDLSEHGGQLRRHIGEIKDGA
ncbi:MULTISPECIES: sugar transferase [unclassified Microbacterium]|uniref:sugar transferase n=1 Tax=unclassified Microbacterium TaxID=2609290 RepID=UPI00109CB67F|nr:MULTISPECIES: sugar transferase [unclassified Microbacterium]